jgi:hypothetical protein
MAEHSQGPFETDRKGIIDANGDPLFLTGSDGTVWWKNDADAHLLATAPELLSSLKEIIAVLEGNHWCVSSDVYAAIAKAEGRSHG